MFDAFEKLQGIYRDEACEWIKDQSIPQGLSSSEKIEFAVSSVRNMDLPESEKIQRAYYRARAVLGDETDSIRTGDFQKGLMRYFLSNKKPTYNSDKSYLEDKIKEVFLRHVIDSSYKDTMTTYSMYALEEKPLTPNSVFQKFLDAGEIKGLADVLLHAAYHTDGAKDIPERQQAMNSSVAKLIAKFTNRSDLHEVDIEMLRANGDLKPKPIWQSDFYLDHVVEPVSDELRERAKRSVPPEDSVFWKIRDQLTDQEIFNHCISGNDKDLGLKKWVGAMAVFEELTGKTLTIRQALDFNPKHRFSLAETPAFKAYLDGEGADDPADYRNIEIEWQDEGYDRDDGVYRSRATLLSSAFSLPEVSEAFGNMTLSIKPIRETIEGINAFTVGMEFESKKEMLEERQGIRITLQKKLQELLSNTPMPGDIVTLCIPDGYEAEDVEVDNFKIGDTGKIKAYGYFGGNTPAYKIEGINQYFGIEELSIVNRPKLAQKPSLNALKP